MTLIDILESCTKLVRAELRPGRPPIGVAKTLPPMAVWRFREPSPAVEIAMREAVTQFHGKIAWELDNQRDTWILYPKKVQEITKAKKLAGLLAGLNVLMAEEPEFGILANEEFEELSIFFLQKLLNLFKLQQAYSYSKIHLFHDDSNIELHHGDGEVVGRRPTNLGSNIEPHVDILMDEHKIQVPSLYSQAQRK
jgi:hypothetical protein